MSNSAEVARVDGDAYTNRRAGWLVASVGTVVGLAIMGDSLMYSILPLAAPGLGIALPLVGVLLSANRLVRLASNLWASRFYERLQPRWPFLISAGLGLVATVVYGVATGFVLFLGARVLWGIAWSGLRQGGYQAVWAGVPAARGRLTGLWWGLVRLGSAISVLLGGWLYDRYGYEAAVGMAVVAALLAVPVALTIRWRTVEPRRKEPSALHRRAPDTKTNDGGWRDLFVRPVLRWLITAGFFQYMLSGIVVSTTAIFVAGQLSRADSLAALGIGAATLTGLLHGVRWLTDLGLGPLVGAASDRIGQDNAAAAVGLVLMAALAGALTLTPLGAILCLFVILLCDGTLHVVISAAASGAALTTARPHTFMGTFATATDAGSALGPLVAYSLVAAVGLPVVYAGSGVLLALALWRFWSQSRRR